MSGAPVHAGRSHLHQDLVRGGGRLVNIVQSQYVGGSVRILNDRPHVTLLEPGSPLTRNPGRLFGSEVLRVKPHGPSGTSMGRVGPDAGGVLRERAGEV